MNITESFKTYLESLGLDPIYIGGVPIKSPDTAWWLVTAGGTPDRTTTTGKKVKDYTLNLFFRSTDGKLVYDQLQELEEELNKAQCIQLDGYNAMDVEAISFPTDQDLDVEERTVGLIQVNLRIYGESIIEPSEPLLVETLDQQNLTSSTTTNISFYSFASSDFNTGCAQTFQPSVTAPISKFAFSMKKVGTLTSNLHIEIYEEGIIDLDASNISTPGATIGTSQVVNGVDVSTDNNFVEFIFEDGPTLQAGQTYWAALIVDEYQGVFVDFILTNFYLLDKNRSEIDAYPYGDLFAFNVGFGWFPEEDLPAHNDFVFKQYSLQ